MDRRLLTSKEVAEILRTSQGHLANLRMRGEGPPHMIVFRRKVLYDERALNDWLAKHEVKPAE